MKKFIEKMNNGQATIPIMAAIAFVTMSIGWVTQYYAQASIQDSRVAEVKQTAAVLDSRVTTVEKNISEIKTDIKEVNGKIDKLLWANNINPNK